MSSAVNSPPNALAVDASVVVDVSRIEGSLDPRVFGGLVEHVGRAVYGGVVEDVTDSPSPDPVRLDVLDALRELRVTVVRWPGGNFASGYDWRDGVGEVNLRPVRSNLSWLEEEPNRFGTDEFLAWARRLEADPYLVVNVGTGTPELAQAWVEYCNGTGNTHWANLRRSHGRPEPYGVRYWGLGNEVYGEWQIGQMDVEDYVKRAREFAKVMLWTDPGIELVACGRDGMSDWDRVVIEELAEFMRWHSIHVYTGSTDHWTNVLSPHHISRAVENVSAIIRRVRFLKRVDHQIHVALDEWNVAYRTMDEVGWMNHFRDALDERYTLSDAVAVGTFLNSIIRLHRPLKMANLGQLVNALGAVVTSDADVLRQSIYHSFSLYSRNAHELVAAIEIHSKQRDLPLADEVGPRTFRVGDLGPFTVLDSTATVDPSLQNATVWLVNREPAQAVRARVEIRGRRVLGPAQVELLSGPSPEAVNTFQDPNLIGVEHREVSTDDAGFTVELPACSVAAVRVSLDAVK